MGLEAIYPKPRLSQLHPTHRIDPDVLRGVPITRANHVWSTDMTDIRLQAGFVYLVAVMHWCSRYGRSRAMSITMDVAGCLEALEQALGVATADIFHRDQGAQFTSLDCTDRFMTAGIRISMDEQRPRPGQRLCGTFVAHREI
jgi:putative transposase